LAKVSVQFLGSGDAFGSGGRLHTCILLAGQTQCLVDCGATALIAMQQYGIDSNRISTIFLTHLHGDHASGIPFFILDAQLNRQRTQPLTIVGPPGTTAWYPQVMEVMFPGSSAVTRKFTITIIEFIPDRPQTINGIEFVPFPVMHGNIPAFALRLSLDGKIITYSGDTQWTDTLLAAANGANLFIVEAYFYEKAVKNHLNYSTLKLYWDKFQAKRIILTHLHNDLLGRLEQLDAETARDGMLLEL